MTHPIRIGVQLQPQHADYAQIRDAVRRAEDLGVDIIFNWDHFFPLSGDPDGKHFECWTMLGAWAEQTSRVQIGALVTCNSYRNPELLADMARTVDHISGGRLILGHRRGLVREGLRRVRLRVRHRRARGSRTWPQALPRIKARWAASNPTPTREIPVMIGGGGERKTLRVVAEHADVWHSFGDVDTLARKSAILDEHGADGRAGHGRAGRAVRRRGGRPRARSPTRSSPPARRCSRSAPAGRTTTCRSSREWVAWRDARG